MIVYVLFIHKKSVSKRKVNIIFIKKLKIKKKTTKKTFLVGFFRWVFLGFLGGFFRWFFWVFWVSFFGWAFYCQPCLYVGDLAVDVSDKVLDVPGGWDELPLVGEHGVHLVPPDGVQGQGGPTPARHLLQYKMTCNEDPGLDIWERWRQFHVPRVADPHWFNADPDPAFFLVADPDPGSGSRVWWGKNWKKNYSWKFNFSFFDQKLQFTYP